MIAQLLVWAPLLFKYKRIIAGAGIALTLLAGVAVIYYKGKAAAHLETQVSQLQEQVATYTRAAEADAKRAKADAATLDALKKKADELNDHLLSLENGGGACLTDDDTDRLRDLWQ